MSTDSSTSKIWSSEGFESDFLGRFGCFNENCVVMGFFKTPKKKPKFIFIGYRTLIEKGINERRERKMKKKSKNKIDMASIYLCCIIYENKFIFFKILN